MAKPAAPAITAPTEERVVHLQREWYGTANALCGAPADPTNVPVDLAIANPGALMERRLCGKCVTRFHRIGSGEIAKAERTAD